MPLATSKPLAGDGGGSTCPPLDRRLFEAAHWEQTEYSAGVNPTAAIAAPGHSLGISHQWIDRATEYCFAELEAGRVPSEAHGLLMMTKLVGVAPDRSRAEAAANLIASMLPGASYMKLNLESSDYGVTPLEFAPNPTAHAKSWFTDEMIESHLDRLERDQEPDGGRPISWQPPSRERPAGKEASSACRDLRLCVVLLLGLAFVVWSCSGWGKLPGGEQAVYRQETLCPHSFIR